MRSNLEGRAVGWIERTLYSTLVRRLDFREDHFRKEWPEDGQSEHDLWIKLSEAVLSRLETTLELTCIPEEAVPIPDFTFPRLGHIEYANTEADVVKDTIGVFLVKLVNEGLFWGKAELRWMYWDLVLYCAKMSPDGRAVRMRKKRGKPDLHNG